MWGNEDGEDGEDGEEEDGEDKEDERETREKREGNKRETRGKSALSVSKKKRGRRLGVGRTIINFRCQDAAFL